MKSEHNLSDTLEINVEEARKAVGSLFDNDEDEEIITGYNKPDMKRVTDLFAEGVSVPDSLAPSEGLMPPEGPVPPEALAPQDVQISWPEDDWQTGDSPIPRNPPAPPPKPAIKVNASVPAASRMKPKKPLSLEDEENAENIGDPSAESEPRAGRTRYLFIDDEDEFTSFRKRYKDRDWSGKQRKIKTDRQESGGHSLETGHPPAVSRPPGADRSPAADRPLAADRLPAMKRPLAAGRSSVHDIPRDSFDMAVERQHGIPAPIRVLVIGLIAIMLAMMIFLIFRINSINSQLNEANERLLGIPAIEEELARTRITLYAYQEALAAAEEGSAPLQWGQEGPGNNYDTDYPAYGPETLPPAEHPTGTDRIHTVVSGDNLYRISTQYFGDGSHANIQRIMEANNITDPNTIQVGAQLIIPR